jgi:hypothetical protein
MEMCLVVDNVLPIEHELAKKKRPVLPRIKSLLVHFPAAEAKLLFHFLFYLLNVIFCTNIASIEDRLGERQDFSPHVFFFGRHYAVLRLRSGFILLWVGATETLGGVFGDDVIRRTRKRPHSSSSSSSPSSSVIV